jgi:hypothetical protein
VWFGEPFPRQWEAELAERANLIYQHNPWFHRLMRRRGNTGRDSLWAFTRHWLCALLASRRPDLFWPPPTRLRQWPRFAGASTTAQPDWLA